MGGDPRGGGGPTGGKSGRGRLAEMARGKAPPKGGGFSPQERQRGPDSKREAQPPQQGAIVCAHDPGCATPAEWESGIETTAPAAPAIHSPRTHVGRRCTTSPGAVLMPPRVPGQHMLEEIREQPGVLERVCRFEGPTAAALARRLRVRRPQMVALAARGTSDNAAIYGRYLIETHLCIPVSLE